MTPTSPAASRSKAAPPSSPARPALGARFAEALAGAGAAVAPAARRVAAMKPLRDRLGPRAAVVAVDVTDALAQMTAQHALEWARHGVRANALAPGYIVTDLNRAFFATDAGQAQVKRIQQRLLLASEAGCFITGTTLVVDGCHLVSPL